MAREKEREENLTEAGPKKKKRSEGSKFRS